jgi:hypothetical protein
VIETKTEKEITVKSDEIDEKSAYENVKKLTRILNDIP